MTRQLLPGLNARPVCLQGFVSAGQGQARVAGTCACLVIPRELPQVPRDSEAQRGAQASPSLSPHTPISPPTPPSLCSSLAITMATQQLCSSLPIALPEHLGGCSSTSDHWSQILHQLQPQEEAAGQE